MKKASALWGGISLLIELVILILALVRGNWLIPLLLAVCAGWTLWLRILTALKAAYPNVRWNWTMDDPAAFVRKGGTGRIRVYGIPDFDYVDVTLDRKANLRCDLVKVVPVTPDGDPESSPGRQELDPSVWYELRGRKVLETLIPDLQSRGYSGLTVKENGEIYVEHEEDGRSELLNTLLDLPEKVYWPQLVKVLEREGIAAETMDSGLLLSW